MQKKVVSYHRVSPTTHDRVVIEGDNRPINDIIRENMHKTLVSSIELCRKAASVNNEEIEYEYIDEYKSGKNQENMTAFLEMIEDARAGKISKIYIRRVNRFGRNTRQSISTMVELDELGIPVIFVENGIDTSKPFMKPVMMLFIELAEQERESWEEDRLIGIEKAKANGVKFGQPVKELDVKAIRHLRLMPVSDRPSWESLSNTFGASPTTMIKRLKEAGYWDYDKRTVI